LHHELDALVRAGLTPYDALAAATREAGRYIGADVGVVREGAIADLLLVEGNPLDAGANAARLSGIVLRGEWLPRERLETMKAEVERAVS
jgi:imidazolonepropionase-like amidohydrolase